MAILVLIKTNGAVFAYACRRFSASAIYSGNYSNYEKKKNVQEKNNKKNMISLSRCLMRSCSRPDKSTAVFIEFCSSS